MMTGSETKSRAGGCRGFTLIEVLVAFMILAISIVVVMQLFSGSLKAGAVSTDYFYGIFHAQETMEGLLAQKQLAPGTRAGEYPDGYQWRADIERVEQDAESGRRKLPVAEYRIRLTVFWEKGGRKRDYVLETTKLVLPPEEGDKAGEEGGG
ncbi:MAG TPA: prepilin-type N-terminal cleavage/methylation domain-containing protein [Desulfosalsimonadaceae bacterium]|nr:prepilin-type N-terminal cleavage/methylation domain-containing protein [Desulfosalsimonadaceae bacterium]